MLLADLLFPWLSSFDLNEIGVLDHSLSVQLTARQTEAACPRCAQPSPGVHSRYQRRLVDLPCAGLPVALRLAVRKFFCRNPACPQVVFSERLGEVAAPYARRTLRLRQEQTSLGFDLGGEAGARTAQRQGMPVSADTLLRLIRQTPPPAYVTPRVLGVDDWALRKGQVYGTILVDLEQRQPVDLLSDRSAATLEQWLKAHPGVEVISYRTVRDLAASGLSWRQIAQRLDLSYRTVRKFACADQFPEQATRRSVASKLDPFLPVLRQALTAGEDNALQLWRHLRDDLGYTGSRTLVSRWVAHHRHLSPPRSPDQPRPTHRGKPPLTAPPAPAPHRLSARQAAWLLVRPSETLDEQERQQLERLGHAAAEVQTAYTLAQEFINMIRQRTNANFKDWLARSEATEIPELRAFVAGLRRDKAAVVAALSLPYSNGQVEGQINRLKFIKRSMYGRANFDLLRQRVLAA